MNKNVKVISTTKLRQDFASALKHINYDTDLIISNRGKHKHIILDIDKYEDLLASNDPNYLKEIKKARQQAQKGQLFSLKEVFDDL